MSKVNVLLDYSSLTEDFLVKLKDSYFKSYDKLVIELLKIDNSELTWSNFIQPLINFDNLNIDLALLQMKDFSTDEKIREICSDLETEIEKWLIEQSMRRDLYLKYKYYNDNHKEELTEEQQSYLADLMIGYKINGMELPDEKFDELKEIKKTISELCSQFNLNLGNENYSEPLDPELLKGLPEKFIQERDKITLKYPDVVPIMEYATNREYRKKISNLFKSRCIEENTPLVEKVLDLRVKIAELFGFENYSDYKLQQSMAETTVTVDYFLSNLLNRVKPLLHKDLELLSELAKADGIDKLETYDIAYYSRLYIEKICDFDKEELKKYFPVEKVVSGAFEIYQKLLGYTFKNVTSEHGESQTKFEPQGKAGESLAELDLGSERTTRLLTLLKDAPQGKASPYWHESVELYQVCDTNTESEVGYFYLDLYPREGKYSHAACFPFITKSEYVLPVATMACNFNKGNLTFDEVETFFHEFGHVMHHLSSESTINSTAAFSCEHDFVETPSQMFEEWCYAKETLQMMSDNLPDELVDKLNLSRKLLQGYHYARQLLFGHYDMFIHSSKYVKSGLKPKQIFDFLHKEIIELDSSPTTSEPANFGHLMGGYDAGYYGYAWSLVYAKDLFSEFKKKGMLNSELGMKLRKEVLSKGSIRKSLESIIVFLGREPSNDEFIESIC
jgi:thimet oligopeptidase